MSDEKVNLGKGRPTPKRRDQQVRRTGPVPPPPTTRREAAKRLRAKQAAGRKAGTTGPRDPGRPLLKRDAGPLRARVRDVVDGRRGVIVFALPVLLVYVIAGLSGNSSFTRFVFPIYVVALVAIIYDTFSLSRQVKAMARAEFPDESSSGHSFYAITRGLSFRRMRVPAPRVSPPPLGLPGRGR